MHRWDAARSELSVGVCMAGGSCDGMREARILSARNGTRDQLPSSWLAQGRGHARRRMEPQGATSTRTACRRVGFVGEIPRRPEAKVGANQVTKWDAIKALLMRALVAARKRIAIDVWARSPDLAALDAEEE